jgi:PhnB protein|tara:strand:+ start:40 stop:168 length:129 start_codon:yes stop_codon:yes gene_type:complete
MLNGDCEEAFDFYKRCFGGQIAFLGRYGYSPMEVPETQKSRV